jgi:CheY-like chemotaxis protein
VYRSIIRVGIAIAVLAALWVGAPAQDKPEAEKPAKGDAKKDPTKEDYREFFKTPETLPEYWDAMQFELEVGRPDLAARHLHELLKHAGDDKELMELDKRVGSAAFLRLQTTFMRYQATERSRDQKLIDQAVDDAKDLTGRVSKALEKTLGNRQRIQRFIKDLNGDREERAFAAGELHRSKAFAIPTLVAELQTARGEERDAIVQLLPRLAVETVPPLIAALDIDDKDLRLDLIDVLMKRNAKEVVPHLWYLAGSPKVHPAVRAKAKQALSYLTETEPAKLWPAPIALTREAERYYRHQVPGLNEAAIWRWDDKAKELVKGLPPAPPGTKDRAEEYYGLRFARQALDIEPTYAPAQQVLLSLVLDKAADQAGADAPLPRDVRELLATVNPSLVNQVLDRALTDQQVSVALGAARALGELGETRATKPTGHGESPLVRALSYPDRRVQMAAADALLRIPAVPAPTATGRVVDVLRRFAAIDPQPRAKPVLLLGFPEAATAEAIEKAARAIGFDVEKVNSGTAVLQRLKKAADVDAVMIGTQLPDPGLASLLAQLRQDPAFAGLPLWLVVPWDTQESLKERQGQVEDDLRAFRKRKQQLMEERKRTEDLYLKAVGVAATPFKVKLDKLDKELDGFTQEKEDVYLAARKDLERQLLSAPPAREPALRRLLEHYRHTWLLPESAARDTVFLRRALAQPLADAAGKPLTEPERKAYAERALYWLAQMARGEVTGYDFTSAEDSLYRALGSSGLRDEALIAAIEATGRLPAARGGDRPQRDLAAVVADGKRSTPVRVAAATELLRRIQRSSPALTKAEVQSLESVRGAAGTDPKLSEAVALVIGATRPDARLTGERLKGFEQKPAAPPPKPMGDKP